MMNDYLMFANDEGSMMSYSVDCPCCGKESSVIADSFDWMMYEAGELVQDAFPTMSADDREIIVSGLCKECQSKFFA